VLPLFPHFLLPSSMPPPFGAGRASVTLSSLFLDDGDVRTAWTPCGRAKPHGKQQ
jgi:hypothetical protein